MWGAADRRGIPLPTIVAAAAVGAITLLALGLSLTLLWALRTVLLYVLAASFIALLLTPPVHFLERRGMSRGLAATIVFIIAVLAFAGLVALFTAPLINGVKHFADEAPVLIRQAEKGRGQIGRLLRRFHLQNWVSKTLPKLSSNIAKDLKPAQALSVGAAAASTLLAIGTIAVLSFFELLEAPRIRAAILRSLSPARRERFVRVYNQSVSSVSGYMLGNGTTSVIAGVIVFVSLSLLGVPFALLLGVWVALVDLLPLIGGLLAGVPVVIFAFVHSVAAGIVMLVVFLVYQQIENHVLNPAIMSKTVRLNPLWVLLAVLIGATMGERVGSGLGAFIGALVGIPIGGAVQVIVHEIRRGPTDQIGEAEPRAEPAKEGDADAGDVGHGASGDPAGVP
jgi:predicted PurR-regulated permease PerM